MSSWAESRNRLDIKYCGSRKLMCVEHPAVISNHDKALETIGGTANLEKIYSEKAKRLPVTFRPDDIYSKPTYGDRYPISALMMKVTRRRRKSDGQETYAVEITGLIHTTYRFQSMCDFQYLAMQRKENNMYANIYDDVVITKLLPQQEYMSRDVPLYIPPLAFARVDKPCPLDYMYKADIKHRTPEYKDPDEVRPANYIGTVRQRRTIHTIFVNFGESLPTEPMPESVKRIRQEHVDRRLEVKLRKLFEIKPMYLKCELEHKSGISSVKLKTYLPAMCFYWLDGPWRTQWNKFGYDPTTDPSSKIYQSINFRLRQLKPGQLSIKAKRDMGKLAQWNQLNRNTKHNVKISLSSLGDTADSVTDKAVEEEKELQYKFKLGCVPPHRMMYYPVCYVEIPEVQKLLHSNDGKETTCTEKDGWCIQYFNDHCRDIMYGHINKLLSLEDSIEIKFWRSKQSKCRQRQLKRMMEDVECEEEEDDDEEDSADEEDEAMATIKNLSVRQSHDDDDDPLGQFGVLGDEGEEDLENSRDLDSSDFGNVSAGDFGMSNSADLSVLESDELLNIASELGVQASNSEALLYAAGDPNMSEADSLTGLENMDVDT